MSDAAAAKKPTKIESEALALFNVASPDKIPAVLWALGLRETCSRCGGSGHYSRNAMGSTTCYRCNGRRESAAKLTRTVLEQARAKVAAGELDAARARAAAKRAAKAAVAPKVAAGEAVYREIADAYSAVSRAATNAGVYMRDIDGAIGYAQEMNNALFWGECTSRAFKRQPGRGMRTIQHEVEAGRLDAERALRELDALLGMLVELRDAWRAWQAVQRASFRGAARARLAA